jgi:transposase
MSGKIRTSSVVFNDISIPGKSLLQPSNELIDLFIIASGFEDRTVGVISVLQKNKQLAGAKILVGRYQTNKRDNERAFEKVSFLFPENANMTSCDADNAEQTCLALERSLKEIFAYSTTGRVKVVFDISGSSSFFIFSIMGVLLQFGSKLSIKVCYATAEKYFGDSNSKITANTLRDNGASEVSVHHMFRGEVFDWKSNFLIAVPSYSKARFERTVQFMVNADCDLAHGLRLIFPHSNEPEHQAHETNIFEYCRETFKEIIVSNNSVRCDVMEYRQVLNEVIATADENTDKNIYFAFLGPKLQAIGAAFAMVARREMRLLVSRPKQFNAAEYSSGIGQIWQIDFNEPNLLIDSLRSVGEFRVDGSEPDRTLNESDRTLI